MPGSNDKWYQEISKRLERYFRKHTRHSDAAPDLVQDVMVAALQSKDIEALDNPDAYLVTIAVNLAGEQRLRELWERQNLQALATDDPLVAEEGQPKSPEPLIFHNALQRAFSRLDSEGQDVLRLWIIGCTHEEIADAVSVPKYQVHRYLHSAQELLRSLLNDSPTERK